MPKGHYKRAVREIHRVIGPSIAYVALTQGQFSCIEADDIQRVGQFNWYAQLDRSTGQFYALRDVKETTVSLHVFLSGYQRQTDHKNVISLDNRRHNLREATPSQNGANKPMYKCNKVGLKGVSLHPNGYFRAQIKYCGKVKHIGYFSDPEEAHLAYTQKATELHGEFARS